MEMSLIKPDFTFPVTTLHFLYILDYLSFAELQEAGKEGLEENRLSRSLCTCRPN